ncbi:hypothetical protein D9757_011388 [Collybiopsis confluens]|uniref:FAD-binding PCMH-type domain-containing protein n=1 Tax=Collybiopsis confluens TaxID=2823264 RepID=A0A8H5LR47_9AGAR|nr:hypothetical protein D9757_011388 [Collybiopsis confluens]
MFTYSVLIALSLLAFSGGVVQAESASSPASIATKTCQQLQSSLGPSTVQTSSGPRYSIGANAAWSTFNDEVNFSPTCIVFANSTSDVQTAMTAIYHNGADYAVQSGGHSGMTGWNTIQNGVLISFINMSAISYDAGSNTITLEPGVRWGDAIDFLEPFGVAAVGGRVSEVGTGLLLGGGLSFLSPSQGYASDNYVSLDVVLVDGTVVTATVNNQHADLFKALKGGGNRFGIVTKYVVRAVHTGTEQDKPFLGGIFTYPNSSSDALLGAFAHYAYQINDKNAILTNEIRTTWQNGSLDFSHTVVMIYNGTQASFNKTFAEFLSIPSATSLIAPFSYHDLVNAVSFPDGLGTVFGGIALGGVSAHSSFDNYLEVYRLYSNFSATFASSPDIAFTLLDFTTVPKTQIQAGCEKGGNPMISNPATNGFNEVLFQVSYNEGVTQAPADVEKGRQYVLAKAPITPGLPLFLNEADANQQVFASYGNYKFLKQVYAKYDPTRFNVGHTQGPLGL